MKKIKTRREHHEDDEDDAATLDGDSVMAIDAEDDLNAVEGGDDADEFGGGDEPEQDDIVDEDESNIEDECDEAVIADEEEEHNNPNSIEAIAERHFAEKFWESLGGTEKVLAGNVVGKDLDKLRDHSVNGWSLPVFPYVYEYLQKPYEKVGEENSYPDLRREPSGPSSEAMRCGDSPLALFFFFMPVALWQHIAM
ncbi:hypothetical protein PHMEG_00020290 [Phytophthora megakarya]|uniref:Uncharacterized protein n=1 Tax=Phytophthora megakarya TaxID=4795 RepID=A0A225VQM1_9STRA|nr:hypothetical protein PHMEG_00020290 [Phytophthora megakarya]